MTVRNRYLLLALPLFALALAACSWQGVTPAAAHNGAPSPVGYPAKHDGRYKVIYKFPGGAGGSYPVAALTFVNGVMYGTTWSGGDASTCDCGTVFAGTKVIYSFKGSAGHDGLGPSSSLLQVGNKFYGETGGGGNYGGTCSFYHAQGCGTVYEVDVGGNERVVYRFKGGKDGQYPIGGLVSMNGTLYGVTNFGGGVKGCSYFYSSLPPGCGVIFSLNSSGREKVIYRFKGVPDGIYPRTALLPLDGKLYGMTEHGGRCYRTNGCGTVFAVTTSGKESVIYSFKGGYDGDTPHSSLLWFDGSLWGTTLNGGCVGSCRSTFGTIFKMSTSGKETVVHRFTDVPDGAYPGTPLAVAGNTIYGTTFSGGTGSPVGGTIFSVTSKGVKILHSLDGVTLQIQPGLQGLVFDKSTNALYGETYQGGSQYLGTIFRYGPR